METWFISDTHFGHANIIKYCNRPFNNVDEMNKTLTDNWNSVVKPDDLVYHLGDFSFYEVETYRKMLNGKIILIRGNHDRKIDDKNFDEVHDSLEINIDTFKCLLTHKPQITDFDFNINGHVHDKWIMKNNNVNVGVDQWEFKPISLDKLSCFLNIICVMEKFK